MLIRLDALPKYAAFSPDSSEVVVLTAAGLTFFPVDGSPKRHVDVELTGGRMLTTLLWVQPKLLVVWHTGGLKVVKLDGAKPKVSSLEVDQLQKVAGSPDSAEVVIARDLDGDSVVELVDLTTLELRPLAKAGSSPVLEWTREGVALWSDVNDKGKAVLLSPKGKVLQELRTSPRLASATAVGVLEGSLAVVSPTLKNREEEAALTLASAPKKPIVLAGNADPGHRPATRIHSELGLAVLHSKVLRVPGGELVAALDDAWLETHVSPDGALALQFSRDWEGQLDSAPKRKELAVVSLAKQKAKKSA